MSKNLSSKYYQGNNERLQKKLVKDIKAFLKNKKKKSKNMVLNVTKISQKMKKIDWLSTEKSNIEWEKTLHYNYNLKNITSL